MKNENKSESAIIIIFVIIAIGIIGVIAYMSYSSFTGLSNNTGNNITNEQKVEIYDNSKQEIDTKQTPTNNTNTVTKPAAPIETEISTFSTNIYDKDTNRVDNIALAISKLNDKVVKAGETFSFNDTIGPMNESNGFKKALGFDSNGNKIQISGGGLCQISSTIYNAALQSNLEIVERHPHSRRVYYVPKDKDATIMYGTLDFKFKNNTDGDIKITGSSDTSNVTIKLIKITNGG